MRTRQITPLSDFDKRAILDDMQRYKSKDIVRFIEKDLEYGLTREEVEFYSNKKYSFEKMKIISNAFRRGCSIEDIQALIELDISSMMLEQALEYCYKGVGIGDIKKAIASSTNAREFRCALDNLISESNNKDSVIKFVENKDSFLSKDLGWTKDWPKERVTEEYKHLASRYPNTLYYARNYTDDWYEWQSHKVKEANKQYVK